MEKTSNFNLNLPNGSDFFDIEDFNANTRIIDALFMSAGVKLENINSIGEFIPAAVVTNVSQINRKKGTRMESYISANVAFDDTQMANTPVGIFEISDNYLTEGYSSGTAVIETDGKVYPAVWTLGYAESMVYIIPPFDLQNGKSYRIKLYLHFEFMY